MKIFKKCSFLLVLLLYFTSCEKELSTLPTHNDSSLQLEKTQKGSIDEVLIESLLADIKPQLAQQAKGLSGFEVIYFEVLKSFDTGEITLEGITNIPFPPLDNPEKYPSRSYTIDCDGGTGDWPQTCNGSYSCAKLVKICLDLGGCASVCQNESDQNIASASMVYSIVFS